ncbi:MAG TPA: DivIVA domain-containing protein [Actinomycetota bacterium]|nr:DivIVA domain-containing protein [Actinomycetota bacterium]
MDLTPQDIHEKQFNDAFRGYGHEEVDLFLDQVAESFEKAFAENQQMHHRMRQLEEELKAALSTEDMLKKTLLAAQKTADEAVDKARAIAQSTVEGAAAKAREILDKAEATRAEMLSEADHRARELVAGAEIREAEIEDRVAKLKAFDSSYRARLSEFLSSWLSALAEPSADRVSAPPAHQPGPAEVPPVQFRPDVDEIQTPTLAEILGEPSETSEVMEPEPVSNLVVEQEVSASLPLEVEAAPEPQAAQPGNDESIEFELSAPEEPEANEIDLTEVNIADLGVFTDDPFTTFSESKVKARSEVDEERAIKELFWGED